MKSFKQFLIENVPHGTYNGVTLFLPPHALQRIQERMDTEKFYEYLPKFHKDLITKLKDHRFGKNTGRYNEFMVYSDTLKCGIVIAYNANLNTPNDKTKHIFVISVLPTSKPKTELRCNNGSPLIKIESHQLPIGIDDSDRCSDVMQYLESLVKDRDREKSKKMAYLSVPLNDKDPSIKDLKLYLVDGEIDAVNFPMFSIE